MSPSVSTESMLHKVRRYAFLVLPMFACNKTDFFFFKRLLANIRTVVRLAPSNTLVVGTVQFTPSFGKPEGDIGLQGLSVLDQLLFFRSCTRFDFFSVSERTRKWTVLVNTKSKKKLCDDISFTSHVFFLHLYMAVYTNLFANKSHMNIFSTHLCSVCVYVYVSDVWACTCLRSCFVCVYVCVCSDKSVRHAQPQTLEPP